MKFERGDIIFFDFQIPDTKQFVSHPGLIISNEEVYQYDDCYIMVMLTTSEKRRDQFTFEVTDDMLLKPLNKPDSQVRLHLITYVLHDFIKNKAVATRMKKKYVDRVVIHIQEAALSALE